MVGYVDLFFCVSFFSCLFFVARSFLVQVTVGGDPFLDDFF